MTSHAIYVADQLHARAPGVVAELARVLPTIGAKLRTIHATRDIWCRDYMPIPLGSGRFVQFVYRPDYLTGAQHTITRPDVIAQVDAIAKARSYRHSGLVVDGGNVLRYRTTAIVTEKVFCENPASSRKQLRNQLQDDLEVDRLVVIASEPGDLLGHADGVLHLLDDRTALVNDYGQVEPAYAHDLRERLRAAGISPIQVPWAPNLRSRAAIPPASGIYVNLLITPCAVLLPMYRIAADSGAARIVSAALPRHALVPIDCSRIAASGGSLHCATWMVDEGL